IARNPKRSAVRRSALGRLFAWAKHVGCDPTRLVAADVIQFREWLAQRHAALPETLQVAAEFIAFAGSDEGLAILGPQPPEPAHLRLEMTSPMAPRFDLAEVTPDRLGQSGSSFSIDWPTVRAQ